MHKTYCQIIGITVPYFICEGNRDYNYPYSVFSGFTQPECCPIYNGEATALMNGNGYGDGYAYNLESYENSDPFKFPTDGFYTFTFFEAAEDVT